MIKLLILFITLFGASIDRNGWVTLDRPKKQLPVEGIDPSIWVVFSKYVGEEKFLVRFPEDPIYRYLTDSGHEMEIVGASLHAEHRLWVLPLTGSETSYDRFFKQDDLWVFESLVLTPYHAYFFQTKSDVMDPISHEKFVGSFDAKPSHF